MYKHTHTHSQPYTHTSQTPAMLAWLGFSFTVSERS